MAQTAVESLKLQLVGIDGQLIENGKFKVSAVTSSAHIRSEVREIQTDIEKEKVALAATIHTPDSDGNVAALEWTREHPELARRNKEIKAEIEALSDVRTLRIAQKIVDRRGLTEDQSEAIMSDVDGPFWQSQDLVAIEGWVGSFCSRNGL